MLDLKHNFQQHLLKNIKSGGDDYSLSIKPSLSSSSSLSTSTKTTTTTTSTSNERFPCNVCGKSYLRKRHLQRHMRDECIGIPPRFKCDLCPSKFRRKYHMVRHMNSKHGTLLGGGNSVTLSTSSSNTDTPENLSLKKENFENYEMSSSINRMTSQSIGNGSSGDGGTSGQSITTATCYYDDNNSKDSFNNKEKQTSSFNTPSVNNSDEDWKMKLSLQLISNSLLKERLINAMPFAYNHN